MGAHSTTRRRRGTALAVAGVALAAGLGTAALTGTGQADPLPAPLTQTYVLPDLAPFVTTGPTADTRGAGTAEVDDEYGAPTGGGEAALRLRTPSGDDKVQAVNDVTDSPLAAWVGNASYSAYQGAADQPIQFPSYQLIIDFNGTEAGGFSTLTYEPVYNPGESQAGGQWNSYDVGTTGVLCSTREIPGVFAANQTRCDNGGTKTLAEIVAGAPDAVVQALQINQGSGNPGLDAAVDLVETPTTTYDFELKKPVIVVPTDPTEPTKPTKPHEPGHGGHGGNGGHHGGNGDGQDGGSHGPDKPCGCK